MKNQTPGEFETPRPMNQDLHSDSNDNLESTPGKPQTAQKSGSKNPVDQDDPENLQQQFR